MLLGITPILKDCRFLIYLASGGMGTAALALFYWWIDIKRFIKVLFEDFFLVGTNSIFIYLVC